jgi:peptidoglycan hydrolase-like protein with peptidoglycan-binding domain
MGDRGETVRAVQQALSNAGYRVGGIDGVFGQATLSAVKKFQKDNKLVEDGIVGRATATILLGGSASSNSGKNSQQSSSSASTKGDSSSSKAASSKGSQAKSLDWFNGGYNLVHKNRDIAIYDINAGVSWNAKYINGVNHADVIPASASDSNKIASSNITGSYHRRPVIATIGGSKYAGSMYAVAHGETNYCNYFNGVMCLHFTGSKTHSSGRVDEDHQAAIDSVLRR